MTRKERFKEERKVINMEEEKKCKLCGIEEIFDLESKPIKIVNIDFFTGLCDKCNNKRIDANDFKEAEKEGTITRDESIMCPYCGHIDSDDLYELHNHGEYRCCECDKESDLSIESTFHYTTSKKE